ncbi:MAG: ROK family protein [Bacteroidales bacterium]|nr:ROK family protein [Bacteroidales bacterium]
MRRRDALWGVDFGGTKIEGIVVEPANPPRIISRLRIPTEKEKGYDHMTRQVEYLLDRLQEETGMQPDGVGIGIPGTMEPSTRTLKNANTTLLIGKYFKDDMEQLLGVPVRLANDANCFTLAEARFGAARKIKPDAEVIFGVIMGTGVGGGLVVNGRVITGEQGIAGEWGHNFLDKSGGPCYCGKTGCVETVISGPALEKYYASLAGKNRSLKEIEERSRKTDDVHALKTIERLEYFFGLGISRAINIVDPEIVVLGGGVGNIDTLYTNGRAQAKKFVFNHTLETELVRPELGDSAGVLGAAYLMAEDMEAD